MKKVFIVFIIILIAHNFLNAQVKDVQTIIAETCKKAALENKKAFIIFHASWCVWCHKFDSSLNDPSCKKFFDDNYVIEHITAFEVKEKALLNNPGAEDFFIAHHAMDQGIPAWFIYDKSGNLLADSQLRSNNAGFDVEGSNVGCPSNETEIKYFVSVLKKTSKIDSQQEAAIHNRFILNNDALKRR